MQVTMQHADRLTLAEMREFLAASDTLSFAGAGRKQIYLLVKRVLRAQQYPGLSRKDKGRVCQRTQLGADHPLDRLDALRKEILTLQPALFRSDRVQAHS